MIQVSLYVKNIVWENSYAEEKYRKQNVSALMQVLNGGKIFDCIIDVAIRYAIFMVIYLVATYIVYQIRYTHRRNMVKTYYKNLTDINKIYEREDRLMSPTRQDWE